LRETFVLFDLGLTANRQSLGLVSLFRIYLSFTTS